MEIFVENFSEDAKNSKGWRWVLTDDAALLFGDSYDYEHYDLVLMHMGGLSGDEDAPAIWEKYENAATGYVQFDKEEPYAEVIDTGDLGISRKDLEALVMNEWNKL